MKRLLAAFFIVFAAGGVAVCGDMTPVYVAPHSQGCVPWCGGKGKTPVAVAQPVYVAPYHQGCGLWCGGKGKTPVVTAQPVYVSPNDYGRAGR